MRATITEIANVTGMAISSVSEILNGKPGYNGATRERVQAIANQLNYRPNLLSRALKGGRSKTIGLFVTAVATNYTTSMKTQAILKTAHSCGYHVYLNHAIARPGRLRDEILDFTDDMMRRHVDGLIFDGEVKSEELEMLLRKEKIPTVFVDSKTEMGGHIIINRTVGISHAVQHLYELGHRTANVMVPLDAFGGTSDKSLIYRRELRKMGILPRMSSACRIKYGDPMEEKVYDFIRKEIHKKDFSTALLLGSDGLAIAAIKAVMDEGFSVPEDLSIVGFDDHPHARFISPPLTTVVLPGTQAGSAAFRMLKKIMESPREVRGMESPLVLNTSLIIRDSTGVPRRRKPVRSVCEKQKSVAYTRR